MRSGRFLLALQTDARLIRGNELWTVGAYAEAEVEFGDVIDANENDALSILSIGDFPARY